MAYRQKETSRQMRQTWNKKQIYWQKNRQIDKQNGQKKACRSKDRDTDNQKDR